MACRRISDRRAEETAGAPLLAFFENGGLNGEQGAAILEFAISLPLLVVFIVGIYDFSGAFNQKQKIAQAAQEGAIIAGAQPMTDLAQSASTTPTNPDSLQPVVTAIFNSLVGSGVLANANQTSGTCGPPFAPSSQTALTWVYTISGCSNNAAGASDNLVITINRGWICGVSAGTATPCPSGPPYAVGTTVQVAYPYRWTFNRVIQLLGPSSYAAAPQLSVTATVHNQM